MLDHLHPPPHSPALPTVGAANVPSFAITEYCFFYPLQGNSGPPGTVGQKGDPGYPGPSVSTCWFHQVTCGVGALCVVPENFLLSPSHKDDVLIFVVIVVSF